jgi:hypothetical protein
MKAAAAMQPRVGGDGPRSRTERLAGWVVLRGWRGSRRTAAYAYSRQAELICLVCRLGKVLESMQKLVVSEDVCI